MVISDAQRFLFVHVQKTGGSTIDKRLDDVLPDARGVKGLDRHAMLGKILQTEPALASYWIVGYVRNPFARLLSWYRMVERLEDRAAKGRKGSQQFFQGKSFIKAVAETYPDFESFILKGTEDWPRLRTPQINYLTTKAGRRADFIGRQESLEADLRAVFARFELPWEPLQSVNVDRHRPDYRELYTQSMRRRVEDVFARDLAAFDYSF
ncbi:MULTISPECIES: sulfotransferase family 2 domain-containing protein [unclassified Nocardioides]|uniref:sulfotransferase family 2 domain-containing protein n=1 Tax=unclassified Nocardioides TaxID=2615069 RepID=UPI0000570D11|nr:MULTISPECIES: sulfotransferase family 2 domain-containing protein [unclassified Nocardioides]ABL82449.1 hypothetical protein Noca_2947 [Nocardioides sp. JS614]